MKATLKIGVPKVLRYTFLVFTAGGFLFFLVNLTGYFGIGSHGPFIRGWVTMWAEHKPVVIPQPDGGNFKIFNFGDQRLVILEFPDLPSLLQARYLGYIGFQNLSWVLVIFILYQMFRIFRNLDLGATFFSDNIRRIRFIALAILAFPIVKFVADSILVGITYEGQARAIALVRPPLLTEPLLVGGLLALVIFSLAEVFRYGTHLQQEQDLTI